MNARAFDPLRHAVFRWLWLASLSSQLGTWTQNVGAVDLMALVAPTALLLSLVQTATSLPGLMLALPAGALADIVDRRRLLMAASAWMCLVSALLAVLAFANAASSWWLLGLTFALGVGTVAGLPAWQAIIPEVVPREELAGAVTLSSVAINVARAVGPVIGGLAVAFSGPGAAFTLTALAFAFTTLVLLRWRGVARKDPPTERLAGAVRSGVRYSLLAGPVRVILFRAAAFIGFASALWALMPVVSRRFEPGVGGYSGLLGSLGAGAIVGVLLLPRVRARLRPDSLTVVAGLAFAAVTLSTAVVPTYGAALALMAAAGVGWVWAISTFNICAQHAAPEWARGRVLASYQVTYMGSMAVGSALWGTVASRFGLQTAMTAAALLLALSAVPALRWRLSVAAGLDTRRAPDPTLVIPAVRHLPAKSASSLRLTSARGVAVAGTAVVLGAGVLLFSAGDLLGALPAGLGVAGARVPPASVSRPVRGTIGAPVRVADLQVTVVAVVLGAQPVAADSPGPDERFVTVDVSCRAGSSRPALVSPYDWVLTDEEGAEYGAAQDGLDGALPERSLPPGLSTQGRLGFLVPLAAGGLVLHYQSELGYESVAVPLG
jgi:MFS family permease